MPDFFRIGPVVIHIHVQVIGLEFMIDINGFSMADISNILFEVIMFFIKISKKANKFDSPLVH